MKVLIVEDDDFNREILHRILEKEQCHVFIAKNGQEAIQLCSDESMDLVFMDFKMPVMDGFEATLQLRKLFTNKELPIIGLSANNDRETKKHGLQIGMDEVLFKPFRKLSIQDILHKWKRALCS